jgi:hypothetical protein
MLKFLDGHAFSVLCILLCPNDPYISLNWFSKVENSLGAKSFLS